MTTKTLKKGEYAIPDNCRAIVHDNKVYIFERLPKGRPSKNKYHCKDCAHRKQGYACFASTHETMVCTQRPKSNLSYPDDGCKYAYSEETEACRSIANDIQHLITNNVDTTQFNIHIEITPQYAEE